MSLSLQWRHIGRDGVSNHQPRSCLLKRLFRRRSKKISKLRVTGLCARNSPVTGEFPAQMASNDGKNSRLAHWGRENMATISQTTFLNVFFLNENALISTNKSPKFVPEDPSNTILALVQIMAWSWIGDTSLSWPKRSYFVDGDLRRHDTHVTSLC